MVIMKGLIMFEFALAVSVRTSSPLPKKITEKCTTRFGDSESFTAFMDSGRGLVRQWCFKFKYAVGCWQEPAMVQPGI